jgi:hypothetical protein
MVKKVFDDEFGQEKEKPVKVVLIITDGEAADFKRFSQLLAAEPQEDLQVQVALVGFGADTQKAFEVKCLSPFVLCASVSDRRTTFCSIAGLLGDCRLS